MKKRTIGILTLLATAGASLFALTQGTFTANISAPVTETPTATVAAEYQPCAYTWAYEDLPEITAELQAAIQAILPESDARAQAFGEDCVATDGSAAFSAMETDFYITIPVIDLYDDETLGILVEQVLSVTDGFASPHVPGAKEGFVEFTFRKGAEQRILRVPILLGKQLRGQGLHGAGLIQALESQ